PAGADGIIEYSTDLFDRDGVALLWQRLTRVLRSAVQDPDARLTELELLAPQERTHFVGPERITVRGTRVDPHRVRDELLGHPAVRDAAVVGLDDRLVGYVVSDGVRLEDLRGYLERRVPSY